MPIFTRSRRSWDTLKINTVWPGLLLHQPLENPKHSRCILWYFSYAFMVKLMLCFNLDTGRPLHARRVIMFRGWFRRSYFTQYWGTMAQSCTQTTKLYAKPRFQERCSGPTWKNCLNHVDGAMFINYEHWTNHWTSAFQPFQRIVFYAQELLGYAAAGTSDFKLEALTRNPPCAAELIGHLIRTLLGTPLPLWVTNSKKWLNLHS